MAAIERKAMDEANKETKGDLTGTGITKGDRLPADADTIKQAEAARMSWCLGDVLKVHGDGPGPGDPLGLHVPGELPDGLSRSADTERAPLGMPERGPEITEIR